MNDCFSNFHNFVIPSANTNLLRVIFNHSIWNECVFLFCITLWWCWFQPCWLKEKQVCLNVKFITLFFHILVKEIYLWLKSYRSKHTAVFTLSKMSLDHSTCLKILYMGRLYWSQWDILDLSCLSYLFYSSYTIYLFIYLFVYMRIHNFIFRI